MIEIHFKEYSGFASYGRSTAGAFSLLSFCFAGISIYAFLLSNPTVFFGISILLLSFQSAFERGWSRGGLAIGEDAFWPE